MTLSNTLISWYTQNHRKLPWRETKDPYLVWVSEIILQQTRVDQGLAYYFRFIKAFPNLKSLSQANEDQVLKIWQGLGYYSRARNMQFAARQIMVDHLGVFPHNYEAIIKLKGIGPYTAAAISSISFDLPYAVVDGNVYRFLSRYYGIHQPVNSPSGKKYFAQLAQEVLNMEQPATHNQAIMEFGALHCKAANPLCNDCPFSSTCMAFEKNLVAQLPKKDKILKIRNQHLNFFFVTKGQKFMIEKRSYAGIWKGLYQLPLIETEEVQSLDEIIASPKYKALFDHNEVSVKDVNQIKHKLTHRNLLINFYHLEVEHFPAGDYLMIELDEANNYAFPKPIENYLKDRSSDGGGF